MTTASIPFPVSVRSGIRTPAPAKPTRIPLRERLSSGGAAALSIVGIIGAMAIAALGLLVIPIAAAIAFGPALLALI